MFDILMFEYILQIKVSLGNHSLTPETRTTRGHEVDDEDEDRDDEVSQSD